MTNANTAGAPCPKCGGSGWTLHAAEAAHGGLGPAYRLCCCKTEGDTFPALCKRPGCEEAIPEGAVHCGRCRAEWDMRAHAESWRMAVETLDNLANAMHSGLGLPELDEALEVAIEHASVAMSFYEAERERIRGGA